jgi:Protein of unknown function (DUF2934)
MMTDTAETRDPTLDIEERKRVIAHQIWQDEGMPEGKAEEHWNRACLVLMSLDTEVVVKPEWLKRNEAAELSQDESSTVKASAVEDAIQDLRKRVAAKSAA